MQNYLKSAKLDNVCYEIRGVVLREARRLEEEGHRVLKLNIGCLLYTSDAADE